MSSRLDPHAVTAGGLVKIPPQSFPICNRWVPAVPRFMVHSLICTRPKMSSRLDPHAVTAGGLVKIPPSLSQSVTDGCRVPSHALWYIAYSVPDQRCLARLDPHAVTAGGLVKIPPSLSQSVTDGCQLPSHALWYHSSICTQTKDV